MLYAHTPESSRGQAWKLATRFALTAVSISARGLGTRAEEISPSFYDHCNFMAFQDSRHLGPYLSSETSSFQQKVIFPVELVSSYAPLCQRMVGHSLTARQDAYVKEASRKL